MTTEKKEHFRRDTGELYKKVPISDSELQVEMDVDQDI